MNKKGFILDLIVFLVFAFIIAIIFALWYYGSGLINDNLATLTTPVVKGSSTTIAEVAEGTFGQVHSGYQMLKVISWVLIISMCLTIFVSNFLVKVNPAFIVVYIFMVVVAIILAVVLSNTYEELLTGNAFSETLQSFTGSTFLMLNLPIIATVVGFLGIIFLFSGIIRDQEMGGVV